MGTTLTAALLSSIRAAVARAGDFRAFRLHGSQFRRIIEDHTIGNLVATSVWLALVLAWNLDGRPDRSAVIGLEARGRYLLCPDELSPAVDDRPHKDVLTLRDLSAGTPASGPP